MDEYLPSKLVLKTSDAAGKRTPGVPQMLSKRQLELSRLRLNQSPCNVSPSEREPQSHSAEEVGALEKAQSNLLHWVETCGLTGMPCAPGLSPLQPPVPRGWGRFLRAGQEFCEHLERAQALGEQKGEASDLKGTGILPHGTWYYLPSALLTGHSAWSHPLSHLTVLTASEKLYSTGEDIRGPESCSRSHTCRVTEMS